MGQIECIQKDSGPSKRTAGKQAGMTNERKMKNKSKLNKYTGRRTEQEIWPRTSQ
jgi:hypothetical protein